jgi:hypothetical protein
MILVRGEEQKIDAAVLEEFEAANSRFAQMGERVLGFASIDLDPEHFKRDYEFCCDGWKAWENVKVRDPAIEGWFPMWNLTLVCILSLNDPPRHKVDISV